MQTDQLDPNQKTWCIRNKHAAAASVADSMSMASSAFPGNNKAPRKNGESRDLRFNTNYHMKLINKTLDDHVKGKPEPLQHGFDD